MPPITTVNPGNTTPGSLRGGRKESASRRLADDRFLAADDAVGDHVGLAAGPIGEVEHDVEHQVLEDRPQGPAPVPRALAMRAISRIAGSVNVSLASS